MLPQNVERFIRDLIRSVWELELLLLLSRDPARAWSAEELVRELRASALIVADALMALNRAGLVAAAEDRHRYRAATPELDAMVQRLREAYLNAPAAVTNAIWSKPNSKIQTFADAFRLKKD